MLTMVNMNSVQLTVLLLVLLLTGCESKFELVSPVKVIPDKIRPFLDRFDSEARKRGMELDLSILSFEFEAGIPGGTTQNPVVGRCSRFDNVHLVIIDTVSGLWQLSGNLGKEEIIFHELGHCLLNRNHKDSKFPIDDFSSIMRTVGLLQYGDLTRFTSLFQPPTDIKPYRRDYYIEELFDENTPAPCWSDPNIDSPYPIKVFNAQFIKDRNYRGTWLDPDGSLWFYGGQRNYQLVSGLFEERLKNVEIKALGNDSSDKLWVAGLVDDQLILGVYEDGTLQTKFTVNDFDKPILSVDRMLVDALDRIWISDSQGNLFAQDSEGRFQSIEVIPERRISKMSRGLDSTVYMIKGGLLVKFDGPKEFSILNSENTDLPIDFFGDLEVDSQGNVWLSNNGVSPSMIKLMPDLQIEKYHFYDINMAEQRLNAMTTDQSGEPVGRHYRWYKKVGGRLIFKILPLQYRRPTIEC